MFKIRAAGPVQAGFAQGLPRGRCTSYCPGQLCRSCCLRQYFHNQQCVTKYVSHSLSFPWGLKLWLPTPSHPFPPSLAAVEDGAGSPSLSQREFTAQCKAPMWILLFRAVRGLREPALLHCTPGALLERGLGKTGSSNGGLAAPTGLLPKYLKSLF